jgi:hypothetical protein
LNERRGITHELDLAQGIDFAIYLGGMSSGQPPSRWWG